MYTERSRQPSSPEFSHRVKTVSATMTNSDNYWVWCCETLEIGTWKVQLGLYLNNLETYCFTHAHDAVAFKLRFAL